MSRHVPKLNFLRAIKFFCPRKKTKPSPGSQHSQDSTCRMQEENFLSFGKKYSRQNFISANTFVLNTNRRALAMNVACTKRKRQVAIFLKIKRQDQKNNPGPTPIKIKHLLPLNSLDFGKLQLYPLHTYDFF